MKNTGPLVSVGVPTFNRPEGLGRTLRMILAQSYSNLEIVVSDNASNDPLVAEVVREYAAIDKRVLYFRQELNVGALSNFKKVLKLATGEYFMWAADDDEWSPNFIERCLEEGRGSESVACQFDTLFRHTGIRELNKVPELLPDLGVSTNLISFFKLMQPSLIYGLHRRETLSFFNRLPNFDFFDCYFVIRQILGPGVRTIQEVLYTAGVDSATYEFKYVDAKSKRLDYASFYVRSAWLIVMSSRMTLRERIKVLLHFSRTVNDLIRHHESCAKPWVVLVRQVFRLGLRFLMSRHSVG
jgi:glycosyltransferase involved in cell wall biosynthesis